MSYLTRLLALTVCLIPAVSVAQVRITDGRLEQTSLNWSQEPTWMSGSTQPQHSGLLGRRLIDGRFVLLGENDPFIRHFADETTGARVVFNLPTRNLLAAPDGTLPAIELDLFAQLDILDLSGTAPANAISPGSPAASVDLDGIAYSIGANLYTEEFGILRPFVGGAIQFQSFDFETRSGSNVSTGTEDETEAYLRIGAELDLLRNISSRVALEWISSDEFEFDFNEVELLTELIVWAHSNLYLRTGPVFDFEGNVGVFAGGGLAF